MNAVQSIACSFHPATPGHRGLLAELLLESYRPLYEQHAGWQDLPRSFQEYDAEVFQNLDTIGRCVFLTCLDGRFAGFSSFDLRQAPARAVIGHNCIAPRYQNRGLGRAQVLETLRRLKQLSIQKTAVTTGVHDFFAPARRMYSSCGFIEVRRCDAGSDTRHHVIVFERELTGGSNAGPLDEDKPSNQHTVAS